MKNPGLMQIYKIVIFETIPTPMALFIHDLSLIKCIFTLKTSLASKIFSKSRLRAMKIMLLSRSFDSQPNYYTLPKNIKT